jgi:DNA-binding CsgD family transcriptional regulator
MKSLDLGTCIKSSDKQVLFQNDLCLNICGNMVGKICNKGCMNAYAAVQGMTTIKNSEVENVLVDAVVINNGETLTTLIYPLVKSAEQLENEKNHLMTFGLTKSEIIIFSLVMKGIKNVNIQKELFISKATLKTHLNNIYKKLPEDFHQYKNRH